MAKRRKKAAKKSKKKAKKKAKKRRSGWRERGRTIDLWNRTGEKRE